MTFISCGAKRKKKKKAENREERSGRIGDGKNGTY